MDGFLCHVDISKLRKRTPPSTLPPVAGGVFPETKCHHRGGFYSEQLERILEHYPKEQVLVRDAQLDGENANWDEVSDDFRSLCRVLFRAMCADQNSFLLCVGPKRGDQWNVTPSKFVELCC